MTRRWKMVCMRLFSRTRKEKSMSEKEKAAERQQMELDRILYLLG